MSEKDMPMRPVTNVKKRRCLGYCGQMFASKSKSLRICPKCSLKQASVGNCEQTSSGKRINGVEVAG